MNEVSREPAKVTVDGQEYTAFDKEHSWGDLVRWIASHCPDDQEAFAERYAEHVAANQIVYDGPRPKWFVCGHAGEENVNGLPQIIEVCPAFGASVIQFYKRLDEEPKP